MGSFLKLRKRIKKLKRLAGTCGLTKLLNRRSFDRVLSQEVARAHRERKSGESGALSLSILDVDHFKAINDTYGHAVGDAVLQGLGKLLRDNSRTSDIIARVGGEEFSIIMPDTHLEGASEHMEHLRKIIKNQTMVVVGGIKLRITASIGVVEIKDDDDMRSFFAFADEAMYGAKNTGRNRVVVGS